jgi:CheY-like chemotaxis protein
MYPPFEGDTAVARILVIDDEELICDLLREVLEGWGYEVSTALNGESGLALVDTESCDLVITDIFMPEKDGLEVIRTIHRTHPHIPIVAISGGGSKPFDFLPEARDLGAHAALPKPIDRDSLLQTLQELLADDPLA